jgi:hypothetical protein
MHLADVVFVGPACPYPVVHLGKLELPKPTNLVRGQPFPPSPSVDGILHDAQMLGDVLRGNPWLGEQDIGSQMQASELSSIVHNLAYWASREIASPEPSCNWGCGCDYQPRGERDKLCGARRRCRARANSPSLPNCFHELRNVDIC